MTERQELKNFYLKTQNEQMAKLYTKLLASTLTLDQQALDELSKFFIESNLSSEVYANTINLHTDEDEILEYLKLFKTHTETVRKMEDLVDLDFIEKNTEKTINSFIEHHNDTLEKIFTDSIARQLPQE